jgi:hypothetical protein
MQLFTTIVIMILCFSGIFYELEATALSDSEWQFHEVRRPAPPFQLSALQAAGASAGGARRAAASVGSMQQQAGTSVASAVALRPAAAE